MANPGMTETAMTEALGHFLDVDVARYKLITTNLANVDTPGYHTRDLDSPIARIPGAAAEDSGQETGQLVSASSSSPVAHAVRGLMERPDGNNVSMERESLLLAEAQMKFNLGVQLLKDQFHLISTAINSGRYTSG